VAGENKPFLANSAELVGLFASLPPVIRIRPSCNRTVEAPLRAVFIGPVASHVPLVTCKNDAVSKMLVATTIAAAHAPNRTRFNAHANILTMNLRGLAGEVPHPHRLGLHETADINLNLKRELKSGLRCEEHYS
jgi:hypothetical protein